MAKDFSDILKDKSIDELSEMRKHLNNYVPYKQRMIVDEIDTREARSAQQAAIREEARKVTLETLEDWFTNAFAGDIADNDVQKSNEETIADTLGNLVSAGKLVIPRGGYLVTNTKAGISVKAATKAKAAAKAKKPVTKK